MRKIQSKKMMVEKMVKEGKRRKSEKDRGKKMGKRWG
jgi:hypothetical protein